jgi:tetratricopeptide (TPR) repeat protein
MISSTVLDLPNHRKEVMRGCLQRHMLPKMMEHRPANDDDAIVASLKLVDEADIYIGIFAHRYGHVPKDIRNPQMISLCEMEYNRAVERGIPKLIFFMGKQHQITSDDVEQGEGATKLVALKERLQTENVPISFDSPDDLRAEVVNSLASHKSQSSESSKPDRRLPSVFHCFGRGDDVALAVSALAREVGTRVVIFGPPGIGKGTVALKALNDAKIAARFGTRRFCVQCETTVRHSALLQKVAETVDVPPAASLLDLRDAVLLELESTPTALLLDNFETPLHGPDSAAVENLLADLAALPSLGLLVAYRGNRPPPSTINWTCAHKLPPLSEESSKEVFLAITKKTFANDPMLPNLLNEMEGIPLAIKLLAHRATFENDLKHLWELWRAKGTMILEREIGGDRNKSLATSLALSLENEWMKPPQHTLLSCLAFLPDGMSRSWLSRPELIDIDTALSTLIQLGLVEEVGEHWLRLLVPIREYVNEHYQAPAERCTKLAVMIVGSAQFYCNQIGTHRGRSAVNRLRPVLANIETCQRYILRGPQWRLAAIGSYKLTNAGLLGCIGDRSVIDEAFERAKVEVARNPSISGDRVILARVRQAQARVAADLGNLQEAATGYDEAYELASTVRAGDNGRFAAILLKDMADIALAQGILSLAESRYLAAKPILENPNVRCYRKAQDCEVGRATIELRRGNPALALEILDIVHLNTNVTKGREKNEDFKWTEATSYQVRAEVLLALRHEWEAVGCIIKALMEFSPTGDVRNCSRCMSLAVQIISNSANADRLFRRYIDALSVVRSTGQPIVPQNVLFGHVHVGLAKKATAPKEKSYHYRAAEEFWRRIGRIDLVRRLEKVAGENQA